jgi:imidazolonepropionase-like amidohydrolase
LSNVRSAGGAEVETRAPIIGVRGTLPGRALPGEPYPGKLGVVDEGALADLLLVDGNPLENIKLVEDPEKRFLVIMKDGRIYKNTLPK